MKHIKTYEQFLAEGAENEVVSNENLENTEAALTVQLLETEQTAEIAENKEVTDEQSDVI